MSIINAASAATARVLSQAANAERLIRHVTVSWNKNGFGVLANHLACKAELRAAKDELETALATMNSIKWPTPADYDSY
jgi:hypothetical protein